MYEILPAGKKHYIKLLKQYFDKVMIHFDIDIVLMFMKNLSPDQKELFVEDRVQLLKGKLDSIRTKIDSEKKVPEDRSYLKVFSYLEHHLKAELNWLKSINK